MIKFPWEKNKEDKPPESGATDNDRRTISETIKSEAETMANDLDEALRKKEIKLTCKLCGGTSFKYQQLYGVYQCLRPGCGSFLGRGYSSGPKYPRNTNRKT